MSYAYDSIGQPSPGDVLDNDGEGVLVYSGKYRPDPEYLVAFSNNLLHHAWIFESDGDRAVAGTPEQNYANGRSDCAWHETRVPAGEFSYVVACDLNNEELDSRNTQPYLQGWSDETREPAFGQYGGSDAINQGLRLGGKLTKFWGVVNWNPLGYPDNDPHNILYWQQLGVDLIQLIGSPIPGTDQDLVCKPNWWTAGTTSVPRRTDDMYIGVNKTEGWFVVEGGKVSFHFSGTPQPPYGVPADLAGNWLTVPSHPITDGELANLHTGASAPPPVQTPAPLPPGSTVVPIDYDALAKAVATGVTAGMKDL